MQNLHGVRSSEISQVVGGGDPLILIRSPPRCNHNKNSEKTRNFNEFSSSVLIVNLILCKYHPSQNI